MFDFLKSRPIAIETIKPGGSISYIEEKAVVPVTKSKKIEKESKQIAEEESTWLSNKGLMERPYPPSTFEELYESCEAFFSTVNQIAVDVSGLGFKLVLKEGKKEKKEEKDKIEAFLAHPNPTESFKDICDSLLSDWGKLGFGALEIVREAGGNIAEIYNIKASTLWIHKDKNRYCQKVALDAVWFKAFGVEDDFTVKEGKKKEGLPETERANELIFFATRYGKNAFYPVPNILPAVLSALSLRAIKGYNYSFFTNYSIPAMAVILKGKWKEGLSLKIIEFLDKKIKGSDNAHKTLVMETPRDGTVEFEKLVEKEKEGSFRLYMESLEDDILMVYSMPPYRIGKSRVGKLGGSNSREATEIYKNSVIEPLQEKLENIINFQIMEKGLGIESYTFKFIDLDTRDEDADVKRWNSLIDHGSMTPNEVRTQLGRDEYPEGNRFYIGSTLKDIGEAELEKQDEEEMKLITEIEKLNKHLDEK